MNRPADLATTTATPDQIVAVLGQSARRAFQALSRCTSEDKNRALRSAAQAIRDQANTLQSANARDLESADRRGITGALRDRLVLNPDRIESIAAALEQVAALPDPVGRVLDSWQRPNGLRIARVAVPIGVIGVIYESRPNVTADAAALCLKAGNCVVLRGGSEALHSNRALFTILNHALTQAGLPAHVVQMMPDQDRALVGALLAAHDHVDIIVPRGGRSLVERVQQDARVPVFAHLDGNNHLYLDAAADPALAVKLVVNAKMRRPGICGAVETVLVDARRTDLIVPLVDALTAQACQVRGDARAQTIDARIAPASDADWSTEYLDAIIALRVVDGLQQALEHIAQYGSAHTDGIITQDEATAEAFLNRVDSAIVICNASTQFADGGEFGFGAEIGIATGRLHARGPVGLEQLTTFKYQVRGSGQQRP
ncbi:MAG: glutamate-5-semialdehyde dehydrogenase [Pseudomonadota bacterium]